MSDYTPLMIAKALGCGALVLAVVVATSALLILSLAFLLIGALEAMG